MRKGLLYFLTLCLLVCVVTVTTPAAQAAEDHSHCVCGGHANGIGDHVCGENITWEPWDGTTDLKDGGHYYLNDTDGDGIITVSTQTLSGITVSLCLNGVELTSAQRTILVRATASSTASLSICDCKRTGSISSTSTGIAPVLHSYTSSRGDLTINLYSGNLIAKDNDATTASDAGVLRLGNNQNSSGDANNHVGTFNMYGGSISGGMTADAGGNLYISTDCNFNMYGGTISGGQAGGNGGNVFVSGHMNMQGGKISGGSAGSLGGGVYLSEKDTHKATITLGGTAQIVDNVKSNLYLPEGKTVSIGAFAKPARIGVTPVTATNFASTANEGDARYFFSDNGKYAVIWSNGSLRLDRHTHCICGGSAVGIADHQCSGITWTSLSAALKAKNMTADTADFGKLAAGNYFLDCDITVTGSTNLTKNISLCLNGYSISREEGKIFGYLKNGYTLNICDCSGEQTNGSWRWDGSVNGGIHTYGSVIYTHYGSTVNIYGGNFTGKATSNGGVFIAANDGAPDLNGDKVISSEEKNLATPSILKLYNGAVFGSKSASKNTTIASYHTAQAYWYGGQLHTGTKEVAVILQQDGLLSDGYTSLAAAVKNAEAGQYIRLIGDCDENITLSQNYFLDLNGHKLSGITVDAAVHVIDTAGGGQLRCTVTDNGSLPRDFTVTVPGLGQQHYLVAEKDGVLSFLRMDAQLTKISIDPSVAGMGYAGRFDVSPALASQVKSYGMQLWLDGYDIHSYTSKKPFTSGVELTLRLRNVLKTDNDFLTNYYNADTKINARLFIKLADGSVITTQTVSYDLREALEAVDDHFLSLTATQKTGLQALYTQYEDLMLGWDMPNVIHVKGWTAVDDAGFKKLLTDSGKTFSLAGQEMPEYYIKAGKYILTEDVDLSSAKIDEKTGNIICTTPTIHIKTGEHVSICLNGHTISTDSRMFRVYGTLDICDCSTHDGSLTSSFSGSSAAYSPIAYIYSGTMNIYGGNITATGEVTSAGVLAVGKSGSRLGTLNIFGGTVSGGRATDNGGLISLFDSSTINMYDGILTGGWSGGSSGAIAIGVSAHANLYGGLICNNHADNAGGGIQVNSGQTQVYLGKHLTIRDNTAGNKGGNIYTRGDLPVIVDGATVTGGNALQGGGLYCVSKSVTLSGDTVISGNENGNLLLSADTVVDATGLTENAKILAYNLSALPLGNVAGWNQLTWERSGYKTATIGGTPVVIPVDFTIPTEVEGFQVGHGRADINPTELDMPLAGYGNAESRLSKELDPNAPLTVTTVAITDEAGQTVLIISADLIRPAEDLTATLLPAISAATGVPEGNIFMTFTHTHSAPETKSTSDPTIIRYRAMLPDRFAQSANLAMADRAPATMETGDFEVTDPTTGKPLNFTRHYYYYKKVNAGEGQYGYNPTTKQWEEGYGNKDYIKHYCGDNFGTKPSAADRTSDKYFHVTEADHTMHLVKFVRDGKDIVMANWRVHPHFTGGSSKYTVSADIIGTTQAYFEKNTDCHFIYLQGAAGNINEVSSIIDENHRYDKKHVEYGRALATSIINQMDQCLRPVDKIGLWQIDNYSYTAHADIPTEEEYNHAVNARSIYNAWLADNPNATSAQKKAKCEELGYLTWFHFNNVISRHSMDKTTQMPLNTFALGEDLAFFTAPGELWDTVSMEVEAASPFAMTLCIGYSMDHFNYFVYDPNNGGQMTYESYESNNYRFVAPTTINAMLAYWKSTLTELYANLDK